jgi:polar amino acid transport system substrate-binding protein
VLVRADSSIYAPKDLVGQRVGGLADSTNIALVEGFAGAKTVAFPGTDKVLPEMMAALRVGEIDALIDDELVLIVAAKMIQTSGLLSAFHPGSLCDRAT